MVELPQWNVFSCLLPIFYSIFLYYWVLRILHIFWILVLCQICGLQILSPSLWLVFSCSSHGLLLFINLSFYRLCFCVKSKNPSIHPSVQFSSVTQLSLCDPMDCSTPGLPVHHQLPEFTQIHVHWVSDAIQPSHPPSSPSSLTFNLSQHQGLFQWVSSSHQVAKVLEFQLQHQSFQWTLRTDLL